MPMEGATGDVEELSTSDQDLDDELEMELQVSLQKLGSNNLKGIFNPSTGDCASEEFQRSDIRPKIALTFEFPGWGIDICRDMKRKRPSITRHSPEEGNEICDAKDKGALNTWNMASLPASGSPMSEMPDEILIYVMKRLEIMDLCSLRQTCQRYYKLASSDSIWIKLQGKSTGSAAVIPIWMCFKNALLASRIHERFTYFQKGYEYVRNALDVWWEIGHPHGNYSSSSVHGIIRKLTKHDWALFYEGIHAMFIERADIIAASLSQDLDNITFLEKANHACCNMSGKNQDCSASNKMLEGIEKGLAGNKIWQALCNSWNRYKKWLKLVSSHCPDLNHEIMIEKLGATFWTPSIYDKGIISFRSQVVLSYGLRKVLQEGFLWLLQEDMIGSASEEDINLLRSIHHLLQEMDVHDDFTMPPGSYTQVKLRRCFHRNALSSYKRGVKCTMAEKVEAELNNWSQLTGSTQRDAYLLEDYQNYTAK